MFGSMPVRVSAYCAGAFDEDMRMLPRASADRA
jgi:hypothetical protein